MRFIKSLIPEWLLKIIRPFYHGATAWWGSVYFGHPSEKLVVIGVTGTNGKSTTVNLIAKILQEAGKKAGYTSTVTVNINGSEEHLNKIKMTMPSGWLLQKWMSEMLKAGCEYAVLEISSEGLAQNRHKGINFDVAVFTNLTPEHIEAHGGFEEYKKAKGKLFQELGIRNKELGGKKIPRIIIANADDENSIYFKSFKADQYISYGVKNSADCQASEIKYSPQGISYKLRATTYNLKLKGQFDVYNSLAAIAAATSQNISLEVCKSALKKIPVIPGRVEVIQEKPFMVVVDYAYEPEEMRQLYETINRWPRNRLLQVLGPTGGGRDRFRIPMLGRMAGQNADLVFVTTDDPYDDDPRQLGKTMYEAAAGSGKKVGQTLFLDLDRRSAIIKAIKMAAEGDLILITGKGADQKMALADGKYTDWDDRKVAKEELGYVKMNKEKMVKML